MGVNVMAYQYHAHGKPQVIQGRFPGGRPTIIQPKPSPSQPQVAAHVQAAIHRGAPAFYRHVAQRKAIQEASRQASTAHRGWTGNATLLPATFHFAPSIGGEPMPPAVQRKMEEFFGADFSDVRVHVGPQAQQIGALAFTRGSDIYFAPGHYMPHHSVGQRLLGHELAHVVQQRAGRVRNPFGSGVAVVQDVGLEAEADRMGLRASRPLQPTPPSPTPASKERRWQAPSKTLQAVLKSSVNLTNNLPDLIQWISPTELKALGIAVPKVYEDLYEKLDQSIEEVEVDYGAQYSFDFQDKKMDIDTISIGGSLERLRRRTSYSLEQRDRDEVKGWLARASHEMQHGADVIDRKTEGVSGEGYARLRGVLKAEFNAWASEAVAHIQLGDRRADIAVGWLNFDINARHPGNEVWQRIEKYVTSVMTGLGGPFLRKLRNDGWKKVFDDKAKAEVTTAADDAKLIVTSA